jgi:hypothetical protein
MMGGQSPGPLRIGLLGAARIAALAIVDPAHTTGDREGLLRGEAEPGRGLPAGVGMDHVLSQRLELAGPVVFLV